MNVAFADLAWLDELAWRNEDKKVLEKIDALIAEIQRSPFRGAGKPEPLTRELDGWWSRRIAGEHRLVYRIVGTGRRRTLEIVQCRYHH